MPRRSSGSLEHEEALEHVAAVFGQADQRVADLHRLVEAREGILVGDRRVGLGIALEREALALAEAVDRQPAGQLADPGPDRLVVPQPPEVLEGAREDLLEDVLGLRLADRKPWSAIPYT